MFIKREYGFEKKVKYYFQSLRDDMLFGFGLKVICKFLKNGFICLSLIIIYDNIMLFVQLLKFEFYKGLFCCRVIGIISQLQFVFIGGDKCVQQWCD